jgi:hypothetical protein
MTHLEEILDKAVCGLSPVRYGAVKHQPVFEFGDVDDLKKTLRTYGEKALPLIWMLPISPIQLEYGLMQEATVTLNLCTRETNTSLLNLDRLKKSYQLTLLPLWNDLQRQMFLTHQICIIEETITVQKFPDYKVGGAREQNDLWDVLQLTFTCQFNAESECLIHN